MTLTAAATFRQPQEREAPDKLLLAYATSRCSEGLLARRTGTGNGSKGKHHGGRLRATAATPGGDAR